MNQKTVLLLVVVAGAAAGGYYLYKKQKAQQPVATPVATTNPDQRNNALPVNRVGELINEGRAVLEDFKKAFGGW